MMALSGVRSSWLMLARNFDLARLASSARVLLLTVFVGEDRKLQRLRLQRLLRCAQVGDRVDLAALAFHQFLFVRVSAVMSVPTEHVTAVLGALFTDMQPAAVIEADLEVRAGGNLGFRFSIFLCSTGLRPAASAASRRHLSEPYGFIRRGRAVPGTCCCTARGGFPSHKNEGFRVICLDRVAQADIGSDGLFDPTSSVPPASTPMPIRCGPASPSWCGPLPPALPTRPDVQRA